MIHHSDRDAIWEISTWDGARKKRVPPPLSLRCREPMRWASGGGRSLFYRAVRWEKDGIQQPGAQQDAAGWPHTAYTFSITRSFCWGKEKCCTETDIWYSFAVSTLLVKTKQQSRDCKGVPNSSNVREIVWGRSKNLSLSPTYSWQSLNCHLNQFFTFGFGNPWIKFCKENLNL